MKPTILRMHSRVAVLARLLIVLPAFFTWSSPVLLARTASSGPSVYVVSIGPDGPMFGAVNLSNGAFTGIAPTPAAMSNLVWWKGSLLSLATSDPIAGYLVKINPDNGETTVIGPTGLGFDAFDLAEVGGKLYLTDFNIGGSFQNLYSVDPQTGAATLIGPTGIPADVNPPFTQNADLTLNLCDESLYGVGGALYATFDSFNVNESTLATDENPANSTISPGLYRIDPASGKTTRVGPANLFLGASVEVNGKSYVLKGLITGFFDGFPSVFSQLLTLDLATGKVTFVRNVDVSAGAIFGAAPAPALSAAAGQEHALPAKEEEPHVTRRWR